MSIILYGVDPGSSHVGIVKVTLSDTLDDIVNIEPTHIDVSKAKPVRPFQTPITSRLSNVAYDFDKMLREDKPRMIVFESGFIFNKRPTAIIPLAKSLGLLEYLTSRHSIKFTHLSPMEARKMLGVGGHAKKEDVLSHFLKRKEITKVISKKTILSLTDHETDAMGLIFGLLPLIKKNKDILLI